MARVLLIERAELLMQLRAFLADARAGSGRVVLLGGEAGVGKTSLARAFVARDAASARVFWGSCEPLVTPEALGPFHDMPPIAPVIAAQPSRVELLGALLEELRISPATVMVIEDAHWADDATLDAIRFLGRRVHATHGLLVLTFREDDASGSPLRAVLGDLATAPGCRRLHVAPLTVKAVAELAAGHAVEAGRLHAVTGGNSFYVTEVLAADGWTVPPTVTDAVLARASRLDPAARVVLEVVSLDPGGLEPAIAVELSGGDPGSLDTCIDRSMLVMGPERVSFRHELARLAIEESLPASRRRRLHKRLLDQLERLGDTDAARLAHHADAGGDAAAVVRHARAAARQASQRGAHRAAAEHLGRAVARTSSTAPAVLADLVAAWADERMLFDDPRPVIALRRRAVELYRRAGNRRRESRELIELGRMLVRLGDLAAAEQIQTNAIDILELLPPGPELALAYAHTAYLDMLFWRLDQALRRASKAIELAASSGGATAAAILALRVRAWVETVGNRSVAIETYGRARRLAEAAGDHDSSIAVVIDIGQDLLNSRRYAEAMRSLDEAVDLGRAIDLDFRVNGAETLIAQIHFEQGRWTEAERLIDRLLLEQRHHPHVRVAALTIRARISVRRGRPSAEASLEEAWAITERGEYKDRWDIAIGRVEAAWLSGRAEEIPSLVGSVWEEPGWPLVEWRAGERAFWLWRGGALPKAPSNVAEPYALHIAGEWRGAAAAWEKIGCPYEQADALADGDEPAMRQALTIFTRLGAEPAAARLRERMRRAGIANVPARPHRSNRAAPAQLTRRQLEIVELLEHGLTNAEIAARLFITEKTAGHHVSAILAKLGARSRTEAASTARKMGIVASEI